MSFEDLGLIDTFTCLYDQKPVWLLSIVFLHTSRTTNCCALFPGDPADAVFQGETAAVRTQVGHRDSSLSSNWRDDAPQVVRASGHDFLHNVQLSSFVLCHPAQRLLLFCQRPIPWSVLHPENAFVFFTVSTLFRVVNPSSSFSVQFVSSRHLTCSKCSLAGDSSCHWTCIPACFTSPACSRNLFALSPSRQKYSHISRTCCSFLIIFPSLQRCAFFPANSLHCQFVGVFLLLPSENRCSSSG